VPKANSTRGRLTVQSYSRRFREVSVLPWRCHRHRRRGNTALRRLTKILLLMTLTAAFGLMAQAASATSGAHFFHDTSASVSDTGALVITIDEAGVGQELVNYTAAWTATATYACINNGGNHPKAANKETITSSGSSSFSESPINGRVMATVTVDGTPPGPGSFSCPSGQTLVLASVSYSVTLTDTTNNVSVDLSASRTFFNV
jgi:hypothetical protein